MDKSRIKSILILILSLLWFADLHAIIIPIELEERLQDSKQAVLARVVYQHSYWDNAQRNIYTAHRLEITAYLKSNHESKYIELITLGGVIEDQAQIVFPAISLELGKEYCLFLDTAPLAQIEQKVSFERRDMRNYFQLYAHSQGILPFENGLYLDRLSGEQFDEITLLKRIQQEVAVEAVQPNGTAFRARYYEPPSNNTSLSRSSQSLVLMDADRQPTSLFQAGIANSDKELIISGTGFGAQIGSVYFSNSNDGGASQKEIVYDTDIVSWQDHEIRVKIPPFAGTGEVSVYNIQKQLVGNTNITVNWALQPLYSTYRGYDEKTMQDVHFLDVNGNGGYSIHINTPSGFASDSPALAAFERALDTWKCATGVNWELDKSGTTAGFAKDDLSVVLYNTALPAGLLGLATKRYSSKGNSDCTRENTLWSIKEFDIEFAPNERLPTGFEWNFSEPELTAFQFDFESIALHELGHALGLGHVIDESNVMHFAIMNGQKRRVIGKREKEAGVFNVGNSLHEHCITSISPMRLNPVTDCDSETGTPAAPISVGIKVILEGYYDMNSKTMHTHIEAANLLPTAQPFSVPPYNYQGQEQITDAPTDIVDWILIELRDMADWDNVIHRKAALLRNDGFVLNEDGQEVINFGLEEEASYFIAIYHRSHLPIISRQPIAFALMPTLYDFTTSSESALGESQLKLIQDVYALNAGDFDGNGIINNQDFNVWRLSSATLNAYISADADGNGIINNQDYNLWKLNGSKISVLSQ